MAGQRGYVLKPGEGERLELHDRGAVAVVKADGARTGGLFALVESAPRPGEPGLAPHLHRRSDEALYVLEGRIRVRIGAETVEAGAGAFIHIPRGTVHAFANAGDGPARILILFVPSGLEQYLRDTAAAYHGDPPDPETAAALRRRHDVEPA